MKSITSSITEPLTKGEQYVLSEPTVYRLTQYMHNTFGSELRIKTIAGDSFVFFEVKSVRNYVTNTEIKKICNVTGFSFLGVQLDGTLDFFKDIPDNFSSL